MAHSRSARAAGLRNAGDGNVHGEDTSTATDIENDLVLEKVLVLDDRVHVRLGSDLVLQHLLVNAFVAQQIQVSNSQTMNGHEAN